MTETFNTNVTKVTATCLFKKNGKLLGFRYTATLDDGSEVVVRAKATRLYDNAFQYDFFANYQAERDSLAGRFTFGKNPSNSFTDRPIASFRVEEGAE